MAQIIETVLSDRRISLGNEEYLRPLSIGPNWGKLRIGIRFAINGRSTVSAPGFLQLGFGTDATSFFSADRPTAYLGARFGGSSDNNAVPTFNFVQANNSYYTIANTDLTGITKVNNTITQSARQTTGSAIFIAANSATATEHELAVTFTRAGGTYALFDVLLPASAVAVQAGKTPTQFITDMNNEAGAIAFSNVTRQTQTFVYSNDFTYPLSYVSVYWSKSTPTIEISHLMVTRFY